ncbi:ATP-dependent DNA helicase 2 subunit KU80-like [Panicum virgatum]|uniref:ATP-dependent DNA helicase 2 subunit KU80-like n=1 Tax=Panicum virgatum TaxID=38727 RepID=UPI0019D61A98|nr:ATP-dependent DNA helicase 2 subunit KU80-like [Panicum virgatum]
MARNKEALVLLLDVGPSMHGVLQEVKNICSTLVHKKLVYNRSDEVGIVLFGTKETCNELAKEIGGYKHVTVAHDIKVVDEGMLQALQNLPAVSVPGDFLDAIVVGLDMVIRKFGNTKGKRRLCLITSAQYPLRDPPEGTKEDQVDTIADQMKRHDIKMECIVFREPGVHHNSVMEENDCLLYQFRNRSVAKVVQVDSPASLLGALKTRNVLPVTVFRGDLEVSPNFKIKVWVYKKTAEEKFPTLKKYSDKAPPSDKFASHEVKVDYEYKSVVEPDKVVPPDQRIKGYLYGPQVVPISSAEWEAVKFKPEKGVKLLGFTDRSSISRHHFMKDVCLFIPEPGNTKATLAVSAIARAMHQMNKVAIVRCVWRQGQGNVALGVLTPNISSVNNVQDSFYFNVLPFAEDIREFQFRSFSSLPSSSQPTEEQQEAADNLVKMLDLAPPGREVLKPEFTPNPMLERFYSYLDLKAKQPDANVPPLERCLRRITEPDPDVIDQQTPLIQNLGKAFELKENPKKKKARTQDRLAYIDAGDQAKSEAETSAEKDGVLGALYPPSENVEQIRDLNPVQDFEAMLAKRSSSTWVQKAIEEMQKYTAALLENSREGGNYQKALECFAALRKACIIEQEPEEFNQFLTKTYERLKGSAANFFQLLSSKNISLISKEEAPDSDVTEEMARSFYLNQEVASQ